MSFRNTGRVVWRMLLVATFVSIVIGVGFTPTNHRVVEEPGSVSYAVAVWDDGPAESHSDMVQGAASDPRTFIIAGPRGVTSAVAHLLMPSFAAVLLWFGVIRPISMDMPPLPVRRWRGRKLGVPLHRGPPVPVL